MGRYDEHHKPMDGFLNAQGTMMETLARLRNLGDGLAERSREIIEETVGTESPAARAIADRVSSQLLRGQRDDDEVSTLGQLEDDGDDDGRSDPPDRTTRPGRRPGLMGDNRDDNGDDDNGDDDNELNLWR